MYHEERESVVFRLLGKWEELAFGHRALTWRIAEYMEGVSVSHETFAFTFTFIFILFSTL